MTRVVIVDDEIKIARILSERISRQGYVVEAAESAEEALPMVRDGGVDIVLCDLRLGGMDGLELLRETRKISPDTDFIIMTAYASAETAVEAMRQGAYEYLIKPFQMDEVLLVLKRIQEKRDLSAQNEALRRRISDSGASGRIIGESGAIKIVLGMIGKVAPTDTLVLIQGESGTGKELVASEIHARSARSGKPFIVINAAAVPETLLEGELFGYEKGAFTGATGRKPGQFKLADGGTLFLDEIGDLPLSLQAKVLRAVELGEFLPLGSSKSVKVDVRILAASNRDLEKMSAEGAFRNDLLYRLNVFPITIPPLRSRTEDILPIAESFLLSRGYRHLPLSSDVIEKLKGYSWPGNVRELRNILERAAILSGTDPISVRHLAISAEQSAGTSRDALSSLVGTLTLEEIERALIEIAIDKSGGNKSRAAEMLGVTRRTLYSRMDKYGISLKDGDAGDTGTEI